ncbi:MAG: glycerophosphodiester phosphodiesterase [Xanthomonadales bacterium]|nr:glycerophosphodiester phosphodiesterase [Xanthomonadales bacterium]
MLKTKPVFTVIAHRGASGYLPEHTLESVAMAHAMRVDYIEQDVAVTHDHALVVLHDLYLDAVSDVADRFPGRGRKDGRHYAIDFTLEEIKTLRVHERVKPDGQPEFPGRFPHREALFRVPTLAEEITLIQGLNRSSGRDVGIYIEPKSPAWHTAEGRDIVKQVIAELAYFGYRGREDKAILQSFDTRYLEYARYQLETDLKLVQLIGENSWQESASDFDFLRTAEGLKSIADLVDGIGPWLLQLVHFRADGNIDISKLTGLAHKLGLFVHGYTLRADQLPGEIGDMESAVALLINRVGLDGVFTDHPDRIRR